MKNSPSIVITGAGSGIGFATAKQLLEETSFRLALVVQTPAQEKVVQDQLSAQGSDRFTVHVCDLGDETQILKLKDRLGHQHRNLYGLVNNAGIYPFGGLATTTSADWDRTLNINLKSAFLMCQALVPLMEKTGEGGRIVNVASTAGILPNQWALAYSVSKAALIQLTRTLAKELGKNNITVNCVCPGITQSPMHEAYLKSQREQEEFYAKRGAQVPMGRVGEAQDVSHAISFFLNAKAGWITGDVFVIDGGRLLV